MQNTLSILSCTEEVTRIPNEAQHTSLFHMLKMPYFPHSAACTRNVTRATQLLTPSALHSFPRKLIYSNRLWFIHPTVFIGSFPPLPSCKLELRIMHICTNVHFSPGVVGTFHVLAPREYFLKASGKLSLRFRHSFYIEEPARLLEQFNNCSIRCVFQLLPCTS